MNHGDHRKMPWGDIEESVRLAIELPLSKDELVQL